MITALMIVICAVLVVGWVLAGFAFVASLVSMIPRFLDRPATPPEDSASPPGKWRASDEKFLHDVGIRP